MKPILRKCVRIGLFGLVTLATLLALAWAGVSFWGRTKWDRVKGQLQARGEPLSLVEVLQPEIPDEVNFYATNFWSQLSEWTEAMKSLKTEEEREAMGRRSPLEVFSVEDVKTGKRRNIGTLVKGGGHLYRGERLTDLDVFAEAYRENGLIRGDEGSAAEQVLAGLDRVAPILRELEDAAPRPGARFRHELNEGDLFGNHFYQVGAPISLCQALKLRAVARMRTGDAEGACRDIVLMLRIVHATESDPFLIFKLVGVSCEGIAISAFWEANAVGQWNELQLRKLRGAFAASQPMEQMMDGLRGDRALVNTWISRLLADGSLRQTLSTEAGRQGLSVEQLYKGYPLGLLLNDIAEINLVYQDCINVLKTRDAAGVNRLENSSPKGSMAGVLRPMAELAKPAMSGGVLKAFLLQQQLGLVDVACALEEYRLMQGRFPEGLGDLVPEYVSSAVVEPIPGYPISYKLISPDNYRLVCTAVPSRSKGHMPVGGEWVWNRLVTEK